MDEREINEALAHYEGLVFTTAARLVVHPRLEGKLSLDDLRQILRIKAWYALERWSPKRSKLSRDRFVFACITNQVKDILKAKRPDELFIEAIAPARSVDEGMVSADRVRDRFEERYLCAQAEDVYRSVDEAEDPLPLLPNTLTAIERRFIGLLYEGYERMEIRRALKLSPRLYDSVLASVQMKFGDWAPNSVELTGSEPELAEAA